jgi:hypothetical protein
MGWESTAAVRLVGRVLPPPVEDEEEDEPDELDDDEKDADAPCVKEDHRGA